jgi:hypothetical protein
VIELETDIQEVRRKLHGLTHLLYNEGEDIDQNGINIKVGDGLVIYEPKGVCVEMKTALRKGDLPKNPITELKKHWEYLKDLGFYKVYSFVRSGHIRSAIMCRSAGMTKEIKRDEYSIYSMVIYGR